MFEAQQKKEKVIDPNLADLKDVFQDIIDDGWKVKIEFDDAFEDELRYSVSIRMKIPGIDKGDRYAFYNVSDDVLLELEKVKNQFKRLANLQDLMADALGRLNSMGFEVREYESPTDDSYLIIELGFPSENENEND